MKPPDVSPHLIGPQLHQLDLASKQRCPAPMEVSIPQTMLQKLLDLLKLESHQKIAIQSIIQDQKDAVICTNIDYHNQHESAVLVGLFHATAWVLTSLWRDTGIIGNRRRGVQGYLSSLQRRVGSVKLLVHLRVFLATYAIMHFY